MVLNNYACLDTVDPGARWGLSAFSRPVHTGSDPALRRSRRHAGMKLAYGMTDIILRPQYCRPAQFHKFLGAMKIQKPNPVQFDRHIGIRRISH